MTQIMATTFLQNMVNKMNYDKELEKLINNLDYTPKLLLHSCCAPCSSAVLERLMKYFDISILYYNPNIAPYEEYLKRKEEQIRLITSLKSPNKLDIIDADYNNDIFIKLSKGHESDPERGARCYLCYKERLTYTKEKAEALGYDYFGTTLTLSPYKVSAWINEIGLNLENEKVKFLISDFKKQHGYKRSIELSKQYNLYRQNYCGCTFSQNNSLKEITKIEKNN